MKEEEKVEVTEEVVETAPVAEKKKVDIKTIVAAVILVALIVVAIVVSL